VKRSTRSLLDPPPFFLEEEVRFRTRFMGVYPVAAGALVLAILRWVSPVGTDSLPSLLVLFISAIGATGFYWGWRLLSYWSVWAYVFRRYPTWGGINLAARGELPRNGFLLVLFAPSIAFILLCVMLVRLGLGFGPTLWMAAAVVAGISLRDLHAGWTLLFRDRSTWVKETPTGLDVLKPVNIK